MTREEHLDWAKKRALAYLDSGDLINAYASMASDLNKHEETRKYSTVLGPLALFYIQQNDVRGLRHWIEGFQ